MECQLICVDSLGDDFPTFPQFVEALKQYERSHEFTPALAKVALALPVEPEPQPIKEPEQAAVVRYFVVAVGHFKTEAEAQRFFDKIGFDQSQAKIIPVIHSLKDIRLEIPS